MTETLHPSDPKGRSALFDHAKAAELAGLAKRGLYELVLKEDIPLGANILGSRFGLTIRNAGTSEETYKHILVVQSHTDIEMNLLVHNSTNLR